MPLDGRQFLRKPKADKDQPHGGALVLEWDGPWRRRRRPRPQTKMLRGGAPSTRVTKKVCRRRL